MYVNVVFVKLFVQRNEFNRQKRVALYKNYVSIIIWLALFLSLKHHAFTYYNIFKLMQYVVATLTC